jgi:multicomponent Na+:H+ antiporter subunit B
MKRAITIAVLILVSIPLLIAVAQLPPVGSTDNPTYTHVVPRYLESGPEEAGCENIVTAVILNYRGYDTDGEVTVIFTALVAVLGVLLLPRADSSPRPPSRIPASPVTQYIVNILAPFIVMFSTYMILYGHETPGGGFQGGTILGALMIVLSLTSGSERVQGFFPEGVRPWLQPAAVLMFGLIGIAGMVFLGAYLAFPHEGSLLFLRTPWLTLLEVGIGVGGAAIVASIFWAMEGEG